MSGAKAEAEVEAEVEKIWGRRREPEGGSEPK